MGRVVAARRDVQVDSARTIELTSTVSSVPRARHLLAEDLGHTPLEPATVENALIVATELITNAILHAQPTSASETPPSVGLQWSVIGETVMINVTDGGGPGRPHIQEADSSEDAGRGLSIVDAVALDWGVRSERGRVTVHALVGA